MPSSAETLKEPTRADDRLSPAAFADPPVQTRPGCFWAWLNGSITAEQVTRDLEAMKQGGMRGGEIWDVAAMTDPDRRVPAGPPFLGPKSTRLIVHAIREADRLGLEVGLVASSGWNAGGSWIKPEHAGKGLYQSTTTVKGPTGFHDALPLPELPKNCPRDEQGRPSYLREVADPEAQEQFLYDWNKFVSDRLIESHYATGRKVLQSYGVKLIAEAGGPGPPIWNSNPVDGIQALGAVDIPRGEFWIRHRGIFLVKEIAAAAHVYDKRVVDAESFTTWRRWVDGPLNHMVLQRDKPVAFWGWAAPGEQVTVSFAGQTQTTSADQDRTWKITIAAMPAHAQPQKMTVQGKDETLTLDNILVGDVWVLGGQSNSAPGRPT